MIMHSILIIGQSNMGGRGFRDEVEPIVNDNVFVLRNGRWRKMYIPVNPDRVTSGINLVESFADLYQKEHGVDVGIIPCADGGSSLDQWQVGSLLFDHACYQAELASRTSTIAAVLWHQGESDCGSEEAVLRHKAKFCEMITALRRDLGDPTLPLVIGELSDKSDREKWKMGDRPILMNQQYRELAEALPACGVASAEGLTLKSDGIHFDSVSLREFGKRYFQVYQTLVSDGKEQE